MEIDITNFSVCLNEITDFLSSVEFASFDLVTSAFFDRENFSEFDNSIQRYEKIFKQDRKIQIIKFGLTLFGQENKIQVAKSFNISLFPQTFKGQCNKQFDISIQTLEKLKKEKFDFNSWITKGVPYYTSEQQQMIIDDKSFNAIDFYLDNPFKQQQTLCVTLQGKWQQIVNWVEHEQQDEILDFICRGNEDKRKILQKINHDYEHLMDNIFVREINLEGKMILRFQKCSKTKKKMLQKKMQNEIQNNINNHIGFSCLWNLLKKHFNNKNKAFVGQNLFENFYFLINSFEKKLTKKDYNKFKEHIHQNMFNVIYDTKLLAIKNNCKEKNFENLYRQFVENDQHLFPEFLYQKNKNSPAFRSYQIGCVFLALKKKSYISMLNCLSLSNNNFYAMKLESKESDKVLQQSTYKLEPLQQRNKVENFYQEMLKILAKLQKEKKIQNFEILQDKSQIFVRLKFKLFILKKIKNAFKEKAQMKSLEHAYKDTNTSKLLQ